MLSPMGQPRRIVFATLGSPGDLNPILCVAQCLRQQGHFPVVATDVVYRDRIEALGVGFAPMRPGLWEVAQDPEVFRRVNDPIFGGMYIVRSLVLPFLRESVEDLEKASAGADLLVSHPLTYAVPLVAELTGIPWAATALQPMMFLSAFDPPILGPFAWMERLRGFGPGVHRVLLGLVKASCRHWARPIDQLRREKGLAAARGHPLFEGQYKARLTLALFSRAFAAPQPDWPESTRVTGFPFLDEQGGDSEALEDFLSRGEPPVVFTLGTTAVNAAGGFYRAAAGAARQLGRRAILLVGDDPRNREGLPSSKDLLILPYVPFASLFGRACAIVHQGGVGTTAQSLRSGRPQVVVPYANDQPDNAARVARLGVGVVVARGKVSAGSLAGALRAVLQSEDLLLRAQALGRVVREESGASSAAQALLDACGRR